MRLSVLIGTFFLIVYVHLLEIYPIELLTLCWMLWSFYAGILFYKQIARAREKEIIFEAVRDIREIRDRDQF